MYLYLHLFIATQTGATTASVPFCFLTIFRADAPSRLFVDLHAEWPEALARSQPHGIVSLQRGHPRIPSPELTKL